MHTDPRTWDSHDIRSWIAWLSKRCHIIPEPSASDFPSTGMELVKLTRADFWVRCGSNIGGNTFTNHLQFMMENIMGSPMDAVQRKEHDKDPCECRRPVTYMVFVFVLGALRLTVHIFY